MTDKYSYELITPKEGDPFYRVRDARDNRVASCYLESNAQLVTLALNGLHGIMDGEFDWTCGHKSGAVCAICHQLLISSANKLSAEIFTLQAKLNGLNAIKRK